MPADGPFMHQQALFFFALLSTSLVAVGCASASASPEDFTSTEALHQAAPAAFGCTYVSHRRSSYGTSYEDTRSPICTAGIRCDTLTVPADGRAYAGGEEYSSSETNEDAVTFIGTCEQHEPVNPTSSLVCDTAPVLCRRDPNCLAIVDCAARCGTDHDCSAHCYANGESRASSNAIATQGCRRRD